MMIGTTMMTMTGHMVLAMINRNHQPIVYECFGDAAIMSAQLIEENIMWTIELKIPGENISYFSKNGGYTSNRNDAAEYDDYVVANQRYETLVKANISVAKYGKVVQK